MKQDAVRNQIDVIYPDESRRLLAPLIRRLGISHLPKKRCGMCSVKMYLTLFSLFAGAKTHGTWSTLKMIWKTVWTR